MLALGATMAGLSPDAGSDELASRRAEYQACRAARERQAADEQAAAAARVPLLWSAREPYHSDKGEPYLARRGLDPARLIASGAVRFRADGSPCVLLHDLDTGAPVNIVTRQIARKTWAATEIAVAIVTSSKVFGEFKAAPGAVAYFYAEDTERQVRSRIRALVEARGAPRANSIDCTCNRVACSSTLRATRISR